MNDIHSTRDAALPEIRKALRSPRSLIADHFSAAPRVRDSLGKAATNFAQLAGLVPPVALGGNRQANDVADALMKIALARPRVEHGDTMTIAKFGKTVAMPPQSSNGSNLNADPARAGGVSDSTAGYRDGVDQRAQRFGTPANSSTRFGVPPGPQDDDSLKAIKRAHAKGPSNLLRRSAEMSDPVDLDDDQLTASVKAVAARLRKGARA